jgi:hypothetical protein
MLKALAVAFSLATACAPEAQEARITEALAPTDTYFLVEGDKLDLFIKNANELYNIGWQRAQIAKVYVIEAEQKAEHEHFQIMHVFFVTPDGCIGHYQTVYKAIIDLLLAPDPSKILGGGAAPEVK